MKIKIRQTKIQIVILILTLITILVVQLIIGGKKNKQYNVKIDQLIKDSIAGTIDSFKERTRGDVTILVKQDTHIVEYTIHPRKNKVHLIDVINNGDSVYKESGSQILVLYKKGLIYHVENSDSIIHTYTVYKFNIASYLLEW